MDVWYGDELKVIIDVLLNVYTDHDVIASFYFLDNAYR